MIFYIDKLLQDKRLVRKIALNTISENCLVKFS